MEAMHGGLAGHETAAARVTTKVELAEEDCQTLRKETELTDIRRSCRCKLSSSCTKGVGCSWRTLHPRS